MLGDFRKDRRQILFLVEVSKRPDVLPRRSVYVCCNSSASGQMLAEECNWQFSYRGRRTYPQILQLSR